MSFIIDIDNAVAYKTKGKKAFKKHVAEINKAGLELALLCVASAKDIENELTHDEIVEIWKSLPDAEQCPQQLSEASEELFDELAMAKLKDFDDANLIKPKGKKTKPAATPAKPKPKTAASTTTVTLKEVRAASGVTVGVNAPRSAGQKLIVEECKLLGDTIEMGEVIDLFDGNDNLALHTVKRAVASGSLELVE